MMARSSDWALQAAMAQAGVTYHRDFLSDHQSYYERLVADIEWHQQHFQLFGKTVQAPRLCAWYGDGGARYSYSGITLEPLPWTPLLAVLRAKVEDASAHSYNSVLLNWYRDGSDSMSWHSDDEKELGDAPLIASLSVGGCRRFSLRRRDPKRRNGFSIELAGGSLLVMTGRTQREWQHQLPKTKKPVAGRINLTFRSIAIPHDA